MFATRLPITRVLSGLKLAGGDWPAFEVAVRLPAARAERKRERTRDAVT